MDYKIEINSQDLTLNDHDLFLKLFEEIHNKYEQVPTNQQLTEDITREINIKRGRTNCFICDAAGFLEGVKCLNCNGRGYLI